jgi:hypothetical protein
MRRDIAQLYCTVSCSALATGITLGATESLRLTSNGPTNTFLFDRRYPQPWKVFLNLDNPAQDPATESATRSYPYFG